MLTSFYASHPIPCSVKDCENEARKLVFVEPVKRNKSGKGYGVCEKHWELASKIHQLILEDY